MTLKLSNDRKGFSLLELLLVVAVGILLILAGLAIYRNITNQRLTNDAIRLLNVLKQETQKLYQGQGTYGAVGTNLNAILINADAPPASSVTGAANIEGPWNNSAVTVTAQGNNSFAVSIANVPQAACINLGLAYRADDPDFVSLQIAGAPILAAAVDVATINTACAAPTQAMVWFFQ